MFMHLPRFLPLGTALLVAALRLAVARDVTFVSTSDPHYRQEDHPRGHHNALNRASIEEMNRLPTLDWPERLGGGPIGAPRGVLCLGDLVDDGDHVDRVDRTRNVTREQFGLFVADFGLLGGDGRLAYPVFEGFGNHDGPPVGREKHGFSTQAQIVARNAIRLERKLISRVSTNGLHYAWDWDDVRFIQLNIYPADRQNPAVRYSPVWHDPQGALSFLQDDLAQSVGDSGRPVVLLAHCGFDTNWWVAEDWAAVYAAAKPYRVILYLFGHTGTGVGAWAPEGEERKWTWINDGHTDAGFFVIRLTDDRLRAAYRVKTGLSFATGEDKRKTHTWDGTWGWKWLVDQPLSAAPARP
jgi:cytolysin (calcineurin-like family phosphatase)